MTCTTFCVCTNSLQQRAPTQHFMVTSTASGKMLQLFVTFKMKTQCILKKVNTKEWDVIVTIQHKG